MPGMPTTREKPLTGRRAAFAEVYDGNGTQSARKAGYSGNDNTLAQTARQLLRNPQVLAAIEKRNGKKLVKTIANRQERQEFWTSILRDENVEVQARLKASELLGRSEADFVERVDISGTLTLESLVQRSLERVEEEPDDELTPAMPTAMLEAINSSTEVIVGDTDEDFYTETDEPEFTAEAEGDE